MRLQIVTRYIVFALFVLKMSHPVTNFTEWTETCVYQVPQFTLQPGQKPRHELQETLCRPTQ